VLKFHPRVRALQQSVFLPPPCTHGSSSGSCFSLSRVSSSKLNLGTNRPLPCGLFWKLALLACHLGNAINLVWDCASFDEISARTFWKVLQPHPSSLLPLPNFSRAGAGVRRTRTSVNGVIPTLHRQCRIPGSDVAATF